MFIWVACDLSDALAECRAVCRERNEAVGLSEVAFSLPQHLSLKISFPVADERLEAVLQRLTALLSSTSAFSVRPLAVEQRGEVLWIAFEPSPELTALHAELDALAEAEFSAPPHPYDRDFCFHSTLFMDADTEKLCQMQALLSDLPIPSAVTVDRFLIGCSPSGQAGDYTVCRVIGAKKK